MAAIGSMAFGGFIKGIAQSNQNDADIAAAEYNRKRSLERASNATQQADTDAAAANFTAMRQLGGVRAAYGASGVRMEGTPTDILEQDSMLLHNKVLNILHKGQLEANSYNEDASIYQSQLGYLHKADDINAFGTLLGAGGQGFSSTWAGSGGGSNSGGGTSSGDSSPMSTGTGGTPASYVGL